MVDYYGMKTKMTMKMTEGTLSFVIVFRSLDVISGVTTKGSGTASISPNI
jgi:hypothetical protein